MTNLALYELASEYLEATQKLSELDLDEQTVLDTLEGLQFPIEQKATNVAMFVRNLEASADAIKEAEGKMATRRKAIENRAARIRDYLKQQMERCEIQKIEGPHFRLAIRQNPPAVVVDAESQIPAEFMRVPPPPAASPDKKAIAEAIKEGKEVPGVHLERTTRLEIK